VNKTYTFKSQEVVLTHVGSGECRHTCSIKDKDLLSKVPCPPCTMHLSAWALSDAGSSTLLSIVRQ
jgi:hypothetical protein